MRQPRRKDKDIPAAPRGPGRPTQDAALRARFLSEGKRLFAEKGFDSTSTREIAEAAGGNIGLIAYYFGSKEGLLRTIMEEYTQQVYAGQLTPLLEGVELDRESFRQTLRGLIALHLGALRHDPEIALLAAREVIDGAPRCRELIDGLMHEMLAHLIEFVRLGKRLGHVKPVLHEVTYLMMLSRAVEGYYFLGTRLRGRVRVAELLLDPEADPEAVVDQFTLAFVDGILT